MPASKYSVVCLTLKNNKPARKMLIHAHVYDDL